MASTVSYPNVSSSTSAINVEESKTLQRTLLILDYCIGTFGLIGNIFALIVLGSSSKLRKNSTNILIMHQCIIDMMGALFLILTSAIVHPIPGNYAYCVIWLSTLPFWIFTITSTFSLVLITIERYLAIVHASWYEKKISGRHMILGIAIVWLIGFGGTSPMVIFTANMDPDGNCIVRPLSPSSSVVKRLIGVSWFSLTFLLPVLLHVYCYFRMFYTLWIRMKNVIDRKEIIDERNEDNPINTQKEMKNVVLTLITITACFVTCWFCSQLFVLLYHFGYPMVWGGNFYHFTIIAVFCNSCINPIVFILQYKQFKEQAKKIICTLRVDDSADKYTAEKPSSSNLCPSAIVYAP